MKKQRTKTEQQYLDMVAQLGCAACGMPAQIHHIRQFAWTAQRASDFLTVPLCDKHHAMTHENTIYEGKYLAQTIEAIFRTLVKERVPF